MSSEAKLTESDGSNIFVFWLFVYKSSNPGVVLLLDKYWDASH
jgi:hypothetical protein